MMAAPRGTDPNQTPNVVKEIRSSQTMGDKVHSQEGKSPDRQIRSQN